MFVSYRRQQRLSSTAVGAGAGAGAVGVGGRGRHCATGIGPFLFGIGLLIDADSALALCQRPRKGRWAIVTGARVGQRSAAGPFLKEYPSL